MGTLSQKWSETTITISHNQALNHTKPDLSVKKFYSLLAKVMCFKGFPVFSTIPEMTP